MAPEMAVDAGRQRRRHRPPVRRQPTLPAIADHLRAQHQVLHDETRMALAARARRHRHRDDPLLVDDQLRRLAAAAPLPALGRRRLRLARLLHAARLDRRPALQPLQPRDLIALLAHRPPQCRHRRQQPGDQRFQLGVRQTIKIGKRRHPQNESEIRFRRNRKIAPTPGLLPLLRNSATALFIKLYDPRRQKVTRGEAEADPV